MKTLLLLRHGKSSWKNENQADHERPLASRGKQDAAKIGTLLDEKELVPELIVCSTATRAVQTANLVATECGYTGPIIKNHNLYFASFEDIIDIVKLFNDNIQRLMIVGHNPDMEELLAELTESYQSMPTCALAHIRLPIASWREMDLVTEGQLVSLWIPRQL